MKIGLLAPKALSADNIAALEPLLEDHRFSIELVVIDDRPPLTLAKKIRKHWRRKRGAYILVMVVQTLLHRMRNEGAQTATYFQDRGIDVIQARSLYAESTITAIRDQKLDILILIGGFGIIKEPLLSLAPGGIISYHHGNMRKYRGMPPAFWELYNGEPEMGVTVQKLSPGLDSGTPIVERSLPIYATDTWGSLAKRAYATGESMLHEALLVLHEGEQQLRPLKPEELGQVYTLPNFRQWARLILRVARRKLSAAFRPR